MSVGEDAAAGEHVELTTGALALHGQDRIDRGQAHADQQNTLARMAHAQRIVKPWRKIRLALQFRCMGRCERRARCRVAESENYAVGRNCGLVAELKTSAGPIRPDRCHFGADVGQIAAMRARLLLQNRLQILAVHLAGSEEGCGGVRKAAGAEPIQEVRRIGRQRTHLAGGNVQKMFIIGGGVGQTAAQSRARLHDYDAAAPALPKQLRSH